MITMTLFLFKTPLPTMCCKCVILPSRALKLSHCFAGHTIKSLSMGLDLGGGGGGGYFHTCMYAYWVCAVRETPIFSPKFPFRSISFSQMTQKSSPEHHHFKFFAVPETIIFKFSIISTRSPPPMAGPAAPRVSGRPECQPDTSWQFRRPTFSRSKRLKLGPEPHSFTLKTAQAQSGAPHFYARPWTSVRRPGPFFTLPRHIPTKIWGEYPLPGGWTPVYYNYLKYCKCCYFHKSNFFCTGQLKTVQ